MTIVGVTGLTSSLKRSIKRAVIGGQRSLFIETNSGWLTDNVSVKAENVYENAPILFYVEENT